MMLEPSDHSWNPFTRQLNDNRRGREAMGLLGESAPAAPVPSPDRLREEILEMLMVARAEHAARKNDPYVEAWVERTRGHRRISWKQHAFQLAGIVLSLAIAYGLIALFRGSLDINSF